MLFSARCDKARTDAKFAKTVLGYNPQWGFLPLQAPVAPGQSNSAMPIEK